VLDAGAQGFVGGVGLMEVEQGHLGAEKSGIPGGVHVVRGGVEEADTACALVADVVSERAGEVDAVEVVGLCAPMLEEDVESGGDGGFGELEFADVGLGEGDGREKVECGAGSKAAGWVDESEIESRGDGIDEAAAANAAGEGLADDVTMQAAVEGVDGGDGAGGGAHAVTDASAFEGGAGGGGGAEDTIGVAEEDFAIGAEIHEGDELGGLMETGGEDTGEEIAADESAEGRQEEDGGIMGNVPA
jgi:hypothetical protein